MAKNSLLYALSCELKKIRRLIYRRLFMNKKEEKECISRFHEMYYYSDVHGGSTYWLGYSTLKNPLDCWIYQEILHEVKPDLIIETGTNRGGSALFLASICDLLNKGEVLTIDIEDYADMPVHDRITMLKGSSVSKQIFDRVKEKADNAQTVLVILDSDHRKDHVLEELRLYAPLVTTGSYLIVEDTNLNGHPVVPDFGPGPYEAVEDFLKEDNSFIVDREKEKFHLTFNPQGFLRKIRNN